MAAESRAAGLVAMGFMGALALIVAASRRPKAITAADAQNALDALYGPLPAPLGWAALTWEPITGGLGIATLPDEAEQQALRRVVRDAVLPLITLGRLDVRVSPGGGFVPPTMRGLLPAPCPYGGHGEGLALDLHLPGQQHYRLVRDLVALARFDRAILTPAHVHVQLDAQGRNERRVFVTAGARLLERSS